MTIKEICDIILADKDLQPRDGKTFCNIAVARICGIFGYNHFMGAMANDIVGICEIEWKEVNAEEAWKNSIGGELAIAGWKNKPHGHVAMIYPAPMDWSGSWKKIVPMVANVGKKNGIMRVSKAFPVEPRYFILPTWLKNERNNI